PGGRTGWEVRVAQTSNGPPTVAALQDGSLPAVGGPAFNLAEGGGAQLHSFGENHALSKTSLDSFGESFGLAADGAEVPLVEQGPVVGDLEEPVLAAIDRDVGDEHLHLVGLQLL